LNKDLKKHEYSYRSYNCGKSKKYVTSYEVLKDIYYKIEVLDNVEVKSVKELRMREGFFAKGSNCVNKNIKT
jgi:hypothetical protein